MTTRKLINIAQITNDSKFILYKNKVYKIIDIWPPHEAAKIKAASYILRARSISGLQEEDSRSLEVFAQELLEISVEKFEQKITERGTEFQIVYTNDDGDTLMCGNTMVPFVIPKPKPVLEKMDQNYSLSV